MSESQVPDVRMPTIISSAAIMNAVLNGVSEATNKMNEDVDVWDDGSPRFCLVVNKGRYSTTTIEASVFMEHQPVNTEMIFTDTFFSVKASESETLWFMRLGTYELQNESKELFKLVTETGGSVKYMFFGVDDAWRYLDAVTKGVTKDVLHKISVKLRKEQ